MIEDRRKAVVAGGTGLIGRALVSSLRAEGWQVVVLTRRPGAHGQMRWDGRTLGDWAREVDGADAVVNLAGESIGSGRWTRARKERIIGSRVDSTAALVDAIAAAARKPHVLVNASGIDYPGDSGDAVVTEEALAGDSFLARVCVAWEEGASRAGGRGVRWVAVRTPLVLAREAEALRLLALPFRLGVGGRLGSGRQWFPWIHIEDLVAIFRRAIDDDELCGPVHAVAPEELRQREAAKVLASVLRRPAVVPAPAFALRALLGEQADLLLQGQRARSTKLDGLDFRYPTFRAALEEALR